MTERTTPPTTPHAPPAPPRDPVAGSVASAATLRRRTVRLFTALALMAIGGHVVVARELTRGRGQADLVNRMGRQRTLATRIALAQRAALAARTDSARAHWLATSDATMREFLVSDSILHSGVVTSAAAIRAFDRVYDLEDAMLATARRASALLTARDTAAARLIIDDYDTATGVFVARVDDAVRALADATDQHNARALYLSGIVTLVTLGGVGLLLLSRILPTLDELAAAYRAVEARRAEQEDTFARRTLDQQAHFEQVRRASEERVESIVRHAGSVIIGLRPDGRIFMWNGEAEALFGVDAADAVGTDYVRRFMAPETHGPVRRDIARVLAGTPMRGVENDILLPDGRRRRILWNVTRLPDADGSFAGVVAMGVDLTERYAADERFRVLFDASSDPYLLFDRSGIIDCNAATVRMLGAPSREALIGVHPATLSPERQPDGERSVDKMQAMNAMLRERGVHRFDWVHQRSDGSEVPVEVTMTRVMLQGKPALLVVWHDLTARRAYEAELLAARDEAQEANRAKSSFLAAMSHELRTPLNSIIGFTRQVLKNRQQTLGASDITYLTRVETNGVNLLGLINTLLDLEKIEAGRIELHLGPTDVGALVEETVASLEGQPRKPGVALRAEVPPGLVLVESDAGRLRQVLVNLVGNAIKFTHEGSVSVHVEASPDGHPLAIEVRDTGIGIPEDRIDAIFTAFEQAERTTARDYGGTGLGLAIVESLVALLGLTLTVTSVVGQGSTFRIAFPPPSAPRVYLTGEWHAAA